MSRRTKILGLTGVILLGAFLVFMCAGAFAADNAAVTVSANVASVLSLSMSGTTVNFGGGALQPGTTATGSLTATVDSNKIWSLKVTTGGLLTSGSNTIPSADLTYGSTTASGKVHNVQAAGTEFGTSTNVCNTCDRGNNMSVTINYSLTVPWDVEPGTYTATHTYTATQP